MAELRDRVALVTGASRGLGRAVARALAGAGAHVVLVARGQGGLEETDDAIRAAGGAATLCPLDLERPGDLESAAAALGRRFGRLDVLVGAAAALGPLTPVHQIEPGAWNGAMAVNLAANLRLIRALDPWLRRSEAGRAIFVTAPAARGRAYWGAYAASKAALEALVACYAAETARTALRVNLVEPPPMATALRARSHPGEDPSGLASPDEVAARLLPLAAPGCERHGETVRADGR